MVPENEQGVIVLFAQSAYEVGFEFLAIQSAYPDALIQKGDTTYRIEFELRSSHFIQHGHDPQDCDMIVCWEDDDEENPLPTLALSDPNWKQADWALPTDATRKIIYWRQRALSAEGKLKAVSQNPDNKNFQASTSKRDQITVLLKVTPKLTQREIARMVGSSCSYVCEVAKAINSSPAYVNDVLKEDGKNGKDN